MQRDHGTTRQRDNAQSYAPHLVAIFAGHAAGSWQLCASVASAAPSSSRRCRTRTRRAALAAMSCPAAGTAGTAPPPPVLHMHMHQHHTTAIVHLHPAVWNCSILHRQKTGWRTDSGCALLISLSVVTLCCNACNAAACRSLGAAGSPPGSARQYFFTRYA